MLRYNTGINGFRTAASRFVGAPVQAEPDLSAEGDEVRRVWRQDVRDLCECTWVTLHAD